MFPSLRELDVIALRRPQLGNKRWGLDYILSNSFKHLRKLLINQPFSPVILPQLFFLPNLNTLELSAFDAGVIDEWKLPEDFTPGHSKVTHFRLFAALKPCQLLQIMSWPAALESFAYKHEKNQTSDQTYSETGSEIDFQADGRSDSHEYYQINNMQPPMPWDFSVALEPFRHTLTNLELQLSDCFLNDSNPVEGNRIFQCPLLDLKPFSSLQKLTIPTFFLLGLPKEKYTRHILSHTLPPSLNTLDLLFGVQDNLLGYSDSWSGQNVFRVLDSFAWLDTLAQECTGWGRLPALKKVTLCQEKSQGYFYLSHDVRKLFSDQGVGITFVDYSNCYWINEYRYEGFEIENYGHVGDPVFGKEGTEYSDSLYASEIDEDFVEEEMLEHESWEQFDMWMTEEKAQKGEKWIRGQWPDYDETKERRDEIFRYTLRDI